ncbi:hypothetical protein [Gaetbulibacter jejuensis]
MKSSFIDKGMRLENDFKAEKTILYNPRVSKIINQVWLNILVWKFEAVEEKFTLLSAYHSYDRPKSMSFEMFVSSIKNCFSQYFIDLVLDFMKQVNDVKNPNRHNQCLQVFLPLIVDYGRDHSYVALYISPVVPTHMHSGNSILYEDFYFVAIPLKEYEGEPISFNLFIDMKRDVKSTQSLKIKNNEIYVDQILTRKQLKVFKLMIDNKNSREIAKALGASYSSILKFNIRITSVLSDFFDKQFNSVNEAINYYKKCFCNSELKT